MRSATADSLFVASDIGGTFTDTVVQSPATGIKRYKAPTTPDDLVRGVLDTFELAAGDSDLELSEFVERIRLFSHGTTVATNALLERRGARTGILQTAGFGDTLFIMRGYKGFGLDEATLKNYRGLTKHPSVVDRRLVREIPERVDYSGRVLLPLQEDAARAAIRELVAEGVEAIAVCLLWCTKHPDHERRVAELVREEAPGVYVSTSSEVLARVNEYSRTVTTAVNAFLGPRVSSVTASLRSTLSDAGLGHEPLLMQSNGGVTSVGQAAERPVNFLLSGPVGGVVGCSAIAAALDEPNLVTTDMGGTSFDVGLIVDGQPLLQPTTVIDAQPIGAPSVGVQTIASGGGSIARVQDGALLVGPESAGARPGPACYGLGGEEPTVTDADVVLGIINPDTFLGGRKTLDRDAATEAIRAKVAEPLGMTVHQAAAGIKRIVDAKLSDLVRSVTIHQGYDPREFSLVAFGGAGPVHAYSYGSGLGVRKVIVPPTASVHSAFGILNSDLVVTKEVSRSFLTPPGSLGAADYVDGAEVEQVLGGLERDARELLGAQGLEPDGIRVSRLVDMRFRFQIHELTMELPAGPIDGAVLDDLVSRFIETYEARFGEGSAFSAAGIELVNWRVVAAGGIERAAVAAASANGGGPLTPVRHDDVYDEDWTPFAVYEEAQMRPGARFEGPAIVELSDTNIVVGRDQSATVDPHGNVVIAL